MDLRPAVCASRRLVDYFVEVIAEPADDSRAEESEEFTRKVVNRIPQENHVDFVLPDGVPYFCIPESVASANPSVYERKPIFFSFTLTGGDGTHAYGFALHYFEEFTTPGNDRQRIWFDLVHHREQTTGYLPTAGGAGWRPRVFCLISHHPFFSLFKEIVSWVYRIRSQSSELVTAQTAIAYACRDRSWFVSPRNSATQERPWLMRSTSEDNERGSRSSPSKPDSSGLLLRSESKKNLSTEKLDWSQVNLILSQLVEQATCPRAGGILELQILGEDFFRYHIQRGKASHLDDYCFQMLFQCLSLKNVVYLLNCMLLEQRILVHSNHQGLLTPVCEALLALLFPFAWEHVYIPFLPVKLIEYLHAPVPYFIGLHTSSLATRAGSEIFASCVVVNLDKDKVVSPIASRVDGSPLDFALARFPAKEVEGLLRSLSDVVPRPISTTEATNNKLEQIHQTPEVQESNTAECEVELTFGEGPFGITFESTHLRLLAVGRFEQRHHHQPGASAVVKALPRLLNGLPGPAERSGLISAGSFLIGINGESTLDLTFEETIDRLRLEKRPIRLRFLNSRLPFENACRFAERLQALSLVSALQVDRSNVRLPWVDSVRSAFAHMFTSIFRDFQKHIHIEQTERALSPSSKQKQRMPRNKRRRSSTLSLSVAFNHTAFCKALPARSREFAREFTQTQSFSGFINDSVLGRISHSNSFPQVELFKHCVHLIHEIRHVKAAIDLLFERDCTPLEILKFDLPSTTTTTEQSCSDRESVGLGFGSRSFPEPHSERRLSKARQLEILLCDSLLSKDPLELSLHDAPSAFENLSDIEEPSGTPSTVGSSPTCMQSLEDEINGIVDSDELLRKQQTSPEVDGDSDDEAFEFVGGGQKLAQHIQSS